MDYVKHYSALIQRARTRTLDATKEEHHVIPRCLGGKDCKKNLVALTPEEHYTAHLLLVRMFPKVPGLVLAAVLMSRDNRTGNRVNNKMYGWLRRRAAEAASILSTGRQVSTETRAKLREAMKSSARFAEAVEARRGVERAEAVKQKLSHSHKVSEAAKVARAKVSEGRIGTKHSEATKQQMSVDRKGRKHTPEQRAKISAALKGRPKSAEHVAKVAKALTGKVGTRLGATLSEATKQKMSAAATGRKMKPEDIVKMVNNKTPEQRRAGALKAWETKRANSEARA